MSEQIINPIKDAYNSVLNLKEDFISYMILAFILIIIIIFIIYLIYLSRLQNSECNFMDNLYGTLNGKIRSINPNDPDCSGNLFDYYIIN